MALYLGIDLAWGLGGVKKPNETGLCAADESGRILDAGWVRGPEAVDAWVGDAMAEYRRGERDGEHAARDSEHAARDSQHAARRQNSADDTVVIAIDAPLIVPNETGMRHCERDVGRGYGRWKVGANASNRALASRAGEVLLGLLERRGITYTDGTTSPAPGTAVAFECYPYTTLVGIDTFGYDVERPRYKRLDKTLPGAEARARRAAATDELVRRLDRLATAEPPLDFRSHETTAEIAATPTPPRGEKERKHREDLIDAALCAYTAAYWHRYGPARTQALGTVAAARPAGTPTDSTDTAAGPDSTVTSASRPDTPTDRDARGRLASIVAPARTTDRGSQWLRDWHAAKAATLRRHDTEPPPATDFL